MKKSILLALLGAALTFAFVGCTPTEEASSTNGASMSNTASTNGDEMVKCDMCATEFKKAEMKEVDGKMFCDHCAGMQTPNGDAMLTCACGAEMAKADAVDVNGKMYCAACAEKMKGDVPTEGGHGPDDGHGH